MRIAQHRVEFRTSYVLPPLYSDDHIAELPARIMTHIRRHIDLTDDGDNVFVDLDDNDTTGEVWVFVDGPEIDVAHTLARFTVTDGDPLTTA